MNLTVSRPVKILALVLVIAGVGGIASLSMLGKSSSGSATPPLSVAQIRARAHAHTTATGPAATTAPRATTTAPAAPVKHPVALKPVPATTPAATTPAAAATRAPAAPKPQAEQTVTANGVPLVLAAALRQNPIVVVSVFDPEAATDAVSYAEARAGAVDAHAGFLGVSVLDESVAAPLTALVPGGGLLPLPGVLIFRRPSTLVELVDGFADRGSVAALAANAQTDPPWTPPTTTTAATTPAAPLPAPPAAATDTSTNTSSVGG